MRLREKNLSWALLLLDFLPLDFLNQPTNQPRRMKIPIPEIWWKAIVNPFLLNGDDLKELSRMEVAFNNHHLREGWDLPRRSMGETESSSSSSEKEQQEQEEQDIK